VIGDTRATTPAEYIVISMMIIAIAIIIFGTLGDKIIKIFQ
jgi:hypothetical protein